jgi:UDP:flavonoid glycosyltransferase YjiC (YdhE family)
MHVVLATVGTDGDVFPYLGLGAALRERGHRVTLAAPETYRDRAAAFGFDFCSLVSAEMVSQMLGNPDLWHPFKSGRMMANWGTAMLPQHYQLIAECCNAPDTVVVANPGMLAARLVQEKLRVPTATLLLQPGLLPSCSAPPEMPGGLTLPSWSPRWLGELYWQAVDAAGYVLVARALNRMRAELGLNPIRRLFRWWLSPDLVIGLFPPWYAAPQPDWPTQIRLAGFGRFDGVRSEVPEDVRSFCDARPPPVVFTLGTGMAHAADFFRAAVAACIALGVRGLLLTKFPHVVPSGLPATVRHFTFAPLRQLLPSCGAMVHHGGIGTTSAALEAGCPQLILPLAWDQPDNAARVERMGAGLSLGARQRTARHLAAALARLMTAKTTATCRTIATHLAGVDGLAVAADHVEELHVTMHVSMPHDLQRLGR